nr:glutathione S-transferase 1-like [Leptinotarsa decemlineata]
MPQEITRNNPQMEIPVLDDNGFILVESTAILQYLAEQYGKDDTLYPKDPKARAVVNHRLCFHSSTYYSYISRGAVDQLFPDHPTTPPSPQITHTIIALDNFTTYLKLLGKKYAAGDTVTIADFQLITATMCLESINFDISPWPLVKNWYDTYKLEHPTLWKIVEAGMKELSKVVSQI